MLFRLRPRYQPGHRHDEVSILPAYVKKETAVLRCRLSDKGGGCLLFRFRPRYQPGHRHDEVSILPAYVKKETAVLRCRLSDKGAACSSAFAQDFNPVIGMTRFLFSIFDRLVI